MIGESDFRAELTPRELEVLELMANGYSAKEVANMIGIAPRTVEQHVENLRLKMNARNRVHMITQAVLRGILKPGTKRAAPRKGVTWLRTARDGDSGTEPQASLDDMARASSE